MQTFHPYTDPARSLAALDSKRAGKQRLEARDAVYLVRRHDGRDLRRSMRLRDRYAEFLWQRYRNHPAVLMWCGYEGALVNYYNLSLRLWAARGYVNNMRPEPLRGRRPTPPPWLTREFCRRHRSNLLRKAPEHYRCFWPRLRDDLTYIWPVRKEHFYGA